MQPTLEFTVKFPAESDLFRMFIEDMAELLVKVNMEYFTKHGYPEEFEVSYADPVSKNNSQILETAPFIEMRGEATCITYCAYVCAIWRLEGINCRVLAEKQSHRMFHTVIEVEDPNGDILVTDVTRLLQDGFPPDVELRNAQEDFYNAQVQAGHYCCADCARQELNHSCSTCTLAGCCI